MNNEEVKSKTSSENCNCDNNFDPKPFNVKNNNK